VRPYQVGTAAAIVLIAAVSMYDSRAAFSPVTGTAPGDVGASWYPFWTAAVMGIGAVMVAYRSLRTRGPEEGAFTGRASVVAVLNLVIPMFAYALSFTWLGFYLATALYMGFFAVYLGRYNWYQSLASAVITPLAIYLMFEVGFKLLLPKSIFYPGIPF
jgi:putative tricarboxylic transport membrane protein